MNENLLRQRRNLMLVSLTLLALYFLDIKLDKLGAFGVVLNVGNPKGVMVFGWILWAYFLVRYYQYLREESNLQVVSSIIDQFNIKANAYVYKRIEKQFIQGEIKISRIGLVWSYSVMEYDPVTHSLKETSSGELPGKMSMFWFIRACAHVVVHTPKFTDHVLPIIWALFVPIVFASDFLVTKYFR